MDSGKLRKRFSASQSFLDLRKLPIAISNEIEYFINRALDLLCELTFANTANFYYVNLDRQMSVFKNYDIDPELEKLIQHCILHESSMLYNKDDADNSFKYPYNLICINFKVRTRFLGCMYLSKDNDESIFYPSDLKLIENFIISLADQIAGASRQKNKKLYIKFDTIFLPLLEKSWLERKVTDARYRLNSVLEVSNLINSSSQLDEMIESILLSSRKVMRAQSASMFLVEKETGDLLFSVVSNSKEKELTGFRVPKGQGIVGTCAKEKKTFVINDAQNDSRVFKDAGASVQYITKNLIASPLLVNGECIGVIEVLNKLGEAKFNQNDAELFESFADSVALALQRRILTDKLEDSNKKLAGRLRETQTLHAVTAAMIQDGTAQEMFQRVITEIKHNLNIGTISILIFNSQDNTFSITATSNQRVDNPDIDFENASIAKSVFISNEATFIKEITAEPNLGLLANSGRYLSESCILIPLSLDKNDPPVGLLCATGPKGEVFQDQDFILLKTVAVQLLKGYQNIQMKEAVLAKQAIEKELEITSRIQKNILPNSFQKHQHIKLHAMSKMAKTTGGDFFDYFIHKENGPTSFLVADVSGKSLPAALFMAVSSSILRTFIRMELEPTTTLGRANDLLYEESESGMFVTVFYSHYDPATGIFKYASAGHNEMIIMHKDGSFEFLSGKGHPLGILPTYLQKYIGDQVKINSDDLVILYSDGVVEAEDPDFNEYGMDRFIKVLRDNLNSSVDELVKNVYNSVEDFSDQKDLSDDFTMMAIKFPGVPEKLQKYTFTYPVGRESIPKLRDKIKEIATQHGIYGEILEDILLVVDEASTNIVTHAFKDYSKLQKETFVCDLQIQSRHFIRLLFKDKGRPFQIEKVKSPNIAENLAGNKDGGFGVFLIRSLTDKMDYARKNDMNYLFLERDLTPQT